MIRTVMSSPDARAMHAMQHGPNAYHCPTGHGPLRVWPDANSPSGLSLACTGCGHRIVADVELIELAAGETSTVEPEPEPEPVPSVRLPDGMAPRGLCPDGTVRTTGWLQFGKLPVCSGFLVALTVFFGTAPFLPWLAVIATPLSYLVWRLCTTKWRPASQAVNTQRTPAEELDPGHHIRLYGSAGPVGEVGAVGADAQGRIRLRMVGGLEILRRPGQRVWQVDLRT